MAKQVDRNTVDIDPLKALGLVDDDIAPVKTTLKVKKVFDDAADDDTQESSGDLFGSSSHASSDLFGDLSIPDDLVKPKPVAAPTTKPKLNLPQAKKTFVPKKKKRDHKDRGKLPSLMPGVHAEVAPAKDKSKATDASKTTAASSSSSSNKTDIESVKEPSPHFLSGSQRKPPAASKPKHKPPPPKGPPPSSSKKSSAAASAPVDDAEDDKPMFGTEPAAADVKEDTIDFAAAASKNASLFDDSVAGTTDATSDDRDYGKVFIPSEAVEKRDAETGDHVDKDLLDVDPGDLAKFEQSAQDPVAEVADATAAATLDDDLFNLVQPAQDDSAIDANFDFGAYIQANTADDGDDSLFS